MALPSLRLAPDASRASRPALLVQHNAESEPELFPLLKPHTAVGRGLAADLRLDQAFISSRQCAIEVRSPATEVRGDPATEGTPAPPLATRGQGSSGGQTSTAPAPLPPSVWLTDESRYGTFDNGQRLTLTPTPKPNPNANQVRHLRQRPACDGADRAPPRRPGRLRRGAALPHPHALARPRPRPRPRRADRGRDCRGDRGGGRATRPGRWGHAPSEAATHPDQGHLE